MLCSHNNAGVIRDAVPRILRATIMLNVCFGKTFCSNEQVIHEKQCERENYYES